MSIDTSPPRSTGPIVIDGISYIPSSALLTGIQKISFKDNRCFAVLDPQGEAPRLYAGGAELGVYFNDTRYLGVWEMTLNGEAPVSLASELRYGGSTVVISMTNRDFTKIGDSGRISRDTFLIRRILTLSGDTLYETVEIKNFSSEAHTLQLEQWAGGKFDDVFEVRGFSRPRRGRMLASEEEGLNKQRITVLQYEGLDGVLRRTFIHRFFEAEKIRTSPSLIGYFTRVEVPAKGTITLKTIISFDKITDGSLHGVSFASLEVPEQMRMLFEGSGGALLSPLSIVSDNAILNRSIENAVTDIYMLLTQEGAGVLYPYAGIPWFSAPFGRDGIITAYQLLPWYPDVARGVLDYVFHHLGTKTDAFTDEQPGKAFHELRRGEMSRMREVPFIPYYGSVDATPLVLILLHEYVRWTLDKERLREWWPKALEALSWVENWGDLDRDGFLEYSRQSPSGLINQGWKDSHDSIMHADGTLAHAPIRLCEVQGYAFRARMGMSALARLLDQESLAVRLRRDALELRARFSDLFWNSENQFVYLAVDGDQKPCSVRSSNMGQCLWTHILPPEQASEVARILMSDSMFSGYGIRTLSSEEVAYNPLSYHNGSVWPHDNSLIMEGFRFYGYMGHLEKLALGLIGVLEASDDFRLPELFCGFRRRGAEPPVPYEVACKPQAWAAGSVFLMLKSILGMSLDVDQEYLVFNSPLLTSRISHLEIKGLSGRDWQVDLAFRRGHHGSSVDVFRKKGDLRVLTVK